MNRYIVVIAVAMKRINGAYGKWTSYSRTIENDTPGGASVDALDFVKKNCPDMIHAWICSISQVSPRSDE